MHHICYRTLENQGRTKQMVIVWLQVVISISLSIDGHVVNLPRLPLKGQVLLKQRVEKENVISELTITGTKLPDCLTVLIGLVDLHFLASVLSHQQTVWGGLSLNCTRRLWTLEEVLTDVNLAVIVWIR